MAQMETIRLVDRRNRNIFSVDLDHNHNCCKTCVLMQIVSFRWHESGNCFHEYTPERKPN